eukprot:gene13221-15532_t
MSIEKLDAYSKTQWEKVLYFLSSDGVPPPEFKFVLNLLINSNLTKQGGDSLTITSEGFKFLLKDIYTQIWTLVIVYLNTLDKDQGYIVLETNFRLYAYTSSTLQISLLSLFVKLLYKLPNLTVGILTRESIRTAFLHGITADQIIDFIRQNAHPNLVKSGFPDTVFEQLRIWESERNRIIYKKGVLFNSFPTTDSFNATLAYSKDLSYFLWSDEPRKILVVSDQGSEAIRNFIRNLGGSSS